AAIVVPQFSKATSDAKVSVLTTNLQTVRSQIQLYKMQHNDTFPTYASFANQMTQYTDGSGTAQATKDAMHNLGPYLLAIPENPFTGTNALSNDDSANTAWYYNQATGEFRANGDAYETY
ncbi:MAG TPA: hypothetical protein VM243_19945, partial [Phycisphaerae bacterium]|nr:hypothetical protein [Phycisphaerae bacterium]